MSCKCLHISPSYTVNDSSTQVVFGFPSSVTVTDKARFCWKITSSLPTQTDYNVYVTVNGTNVPVWNKYGNPMTVAELVRNKVYRGYFGSETEHILISNSPITYNCGCNNVL